MFFCFFEVFFGKKTKKNKKEGMNKPNSKKVGGGRGGRQEATSYTYNTCTYAKKGDEGDPNMQIFGDVVHG